MGEMRPGQSMDTAPKDGTLILIWRETRWSEDEFAVVRWDEHDFYGHIWIVHDGKNDHALRGPDPELWWPLNRPSPSPPAAEGKSEGEPSEVVDRGGAR